MGIAIYIWIIYFYVKHRLPGKSVALNAGQGGQLDTGTPFLSVGLPTQSTNCQASGFASYLRDCSQVPPKLIQFLTWVLILPLCLRYRDKTCLDIDCCNTC